MDHHLRCAEHFAGFEPLKQAPGDDGADQRILAVDLEAPERPVNAEPAVIAVEQLADHVDPRAPVAVERLRLEEVLDFEVALPFENPAAVQGESRAGQRGANYRKIGRGGHRKLHERCNLLSPPAISKA